MAGSLKHPQTPKVPAADFKAPAFHPLKTPDQLQAVSTESL